MRREHMIRVRASEHELAQLVANATATGLTLSAYLRWRGLHGAEPRPPRRPTIPKNTQKTKRSSR